MPVRYSTNWMGPVNLDWYRQRGLLHEYIVPLEEDSKFSGKKKGDPCPRFDILEHYSCGRIDIRGADGGGQWIDDEYALAPMISEDWNDLSNWLDTVETDFVWNKKDLLHNFERFIGRPIKWSK